MHDGVELPERLSRREFLKASTASLLAMAVPFHWTRPRLTLEEGQLGRVAEATADVYREPSFVSARRRTVWRDEVLTLEGAVVGPAVPEHNRIWYEVAGLGYIHSSVIQPVRNEPNTPVARIPRTGQLMEVTVPVVDVLWHPRSDAEKVYSFYYETTHWIDGVSRDSRGRAWYRIADDKWALNYYARAEAFRPIPVSELTPISPDVPAEEKRIEVDLTNCWVKCHEGPSMVFTTRISPGELLSGGQSLTPQGDFVTFRKRHSRHMAVGNLASGYDLPGVPWVAYITREGVSFHGTYWHNDFGVPRSHGCINMTPQSARWLYRWTLPVVPSFEQEVWVDYGTRVQIHVS
jgi:hypothetical protein